MAANIVLTGLATNDPVPGNYVEINFAVGGSAGFQGQRPILLIGNKLSSGDATVDTVVYGPQSDLPIQNESGVISRFGDGSELHRMWRRAQKVNNQTSIYAIANAESSGAQATLTITYATTAGATGFSRVWVQDEFVDVAITTGDTAIAIATATCTAINAHTEWAVTADNGTGTLAVVTVTAKQKGPRGGFLRGSATIFGAGVATTVTPGAVTAFTISTTDDSYTNILTTIAANKFYYIVSAANTTAQLTALKTQVNLQALPTNNIRQRVFAGYTGTIGNATALAVGSSLNTPRFELINSTNSDWTPAELAANGAAIYALQELTDPPLNNFNGYGNSLDSASTWLVPSPRDGTAPTRATIKSFLQNGVTPIGVNPNGSTYLVKRITTYVRDPNSPDYRIRDSHRVTQLDFFADDLQTKLTQQFSGKDLGDDLLPGQLVPGPRFCSPSIIRGAVARLITDYVGAGRFQRLTEILAGLIVQRNTANNDRVDIRIPAQVIDVLDQICTALDQINIFLLFIGMYYALHVAGIVDAVTS